MAIINHKTSFMPSIKLIMDMISFETLGDEFIIHRDTTGPNVLNTSTYKSRMLGLYGTASVGIPGYGTKECVAGDMFPEDGIDYDFPKGSDIHIISTSENAAFIGISSFSDQILKADRIQLSPDSTYTVSQGSMAVILCDSFTVNGNASTESYKILVCENNDAVVVAASQGQIIKFTVV